jgi:hypothetical protein
MKFRAFIASLGLVVFVLEASETLAASGAWHGPTSGATHAPFHPPFARPLQHHRHHQLGAFGAFGPGYGGYFYEPSDGEPIVDVPPPVSGEFSQPYAYDVPWDWAHRFPLAPADGAHVPACPEEAVTIRRHDGKEQTINVMRCY